MEGLVQEILTGITLTLIAFFGNRIMSLSKQVKDLHEWHDIHDEEGVKLWYVRRSLEEAVHNMAQSTQQIARLLEKLTEQHEKHEQLLVKILDHSTT